MSWLVVSAVAVGLICTGCTSEAPGQAPPRPGSSSTVSPTSTSRAGEAPPIKSRELDLASYENRVCDLLTLAQLAPFAIKSPGKPSDQVGVGPSCNWNPPDTTAGAMVDVAILSKVGYGWEGNYQRRDRWASFEYAGEINGYPVIHVLATKIDEETGACTTDVGVRNDLVFTVDVNVNDTHSAEYKKPCSVSDRVAGLVIDTLKGGR